LRRDDRTVERIAFQGPDGSEWTVGRLLAETFTAGFLVLQRGRVVAESYDNGFAPEGRHIVFSVSKSITASLAGVLVDRGLLDPDAPVTRYIPEVAGSAYGDCTVRHVLDMTVSVPSWRTTSTPPAISRVCASTGWIPLPDRKNLFYMRGFLSTRRRGAKPHGVRLHYVSPNSDLLGWILERASGARYARLLSDLLWQPMGAEFDAEIAVDRFGAPRSAGGISAASRDLGRFGELMRRRGMAETVRCCPLVDRRYRAKGDLTALKTREMAHLLPGGRSRSIWYRAGNDHDAYCAIGIHGQWIYVDPAAEMVIVKLSSQPLAVDDAMDKLSLAGFDALGGALMG
jgi:CubicO group peptidase (beta-lactamase class C family)